MARFVAKKVVFTTSKKEIETLVKEWLVNTGLNFSVTFNVKDVYYYYLDLVPVISGYLERVIKLQLKSGERKWIIVNTKFLNEIYKKLVDFHHWFSCEGVGTGYRSRQYKEL